MARLPNYVNIQSGNDAGWSSPVARWAHNPKVDSSNLSPATNLIEAFGEWTTGGFFVVYRLSIVFELIRRKHLESLTLVTQSHPIMINASSLGLVATGSVRPWLMQAAGLLSASGVSWITSCTSGAISVAILI